MILVVVISNIVGIVDGYCLEISAPMSGVRFMICCRTSKSSLWVLIYSSTHEEEQLPKLLPLERRVCILDSL